MEIHQKALMRLLSDHGKSLHKGLGQNFLINERILRTIADAAGKDGNILEIGAGVGWLSALLCAQNKQVVTIEIDSSLRPILAQTVPYKNFALHIEDILKADLPALSRQYFHGEICTLVGNLPYYITSDILEKLMLCPSVFDRAVIMVQAEFAERMRALPGSKKYRAMTVLARYFFDISPLCTVSPDCFYPAPHVKSAVILLSVRQNRPLPPEKEAAFCRFVKTAFSNRRKKISVLAGLFNRSKSEMEAALQAIKKSADIRAETLNESEFATLFKQLQKAENTPAD